MYSKRNEKNAFDNLILKVIAIDNEHFFFNIYKWNVEFNYKLKIN